MDNNFILDGMRWSFSSVNSYNTCPRCFKLSYIDKAPQVQNAFAQWGSFCHSILEKFYKNEYDLFDLVDAYKKGYSTAVTENFPPNRYVDLSESYYNAGVKYFSNFNGLDNIEILEVEKKVLMNFEGFDFVGIIDLVYRDKSTGDVVILDHKSKKDFKNKNEIDQYIRQLYLYSKYIKDTFYLNPSELKFNLIRGDKIVSCKYDENKYQEAVRWFVDTIKKIYQDTEFKCNPDDFFCHHLCGVRNHCEWGV